MLFLDDFRWTLGFNGAPGADSGPIWGSKTKLQSQAAENQVEPWEAPRHIPAERKPEANQSWLRRCAFLVVA